MGKLREAASKCTCIAPAGPCAHGEKAAEGIGSPPERRTSPGFAACQKTSENQKIIITKITRQRREMTHTRQTTGEDAVPLSAAASLRCSEYIPSPSTTSMRASCGALRASTRVQLGGIRMGKLGRSWGMLPQSGPHGVAGGRQAAEGVGG